MKRSKKLITLLAVLVLLCGATFAAVRYQEKQEQIKNSGEAILEIPVDTVTALSWDYEDTSLSFHKDEGWIYDEDEAFPVSDSAIESLLQQFESFSAAFIIEDVDDYSQYGLKDPICTIKLTADSKDYTITLGNYSNLDSQRYVSIGDGKAYLMVKDPLDLFDTSIRELIENDTVPTEITEATALAFSGTENYSIDYIEENGGSYRSDDVYYTNGKPLDSSKISSYLSTVRNLAPTDYAAYNVADSKLSVYGLDAPELRVTLSYTDDNETQQSFSFAVNRDPEQAELELADVSGAYLRIGDSQIVYNLPVSTYFKLMAASYDDLRHKEVLPADFADVTALDISLDGETHTLSMNDDGETWTYKTQTDLSISDIKTALEDLSASEFTSEIPADKEEISLTAHLGIDGTPNVNIALYRYDGTSCLATVDGQAFALVPREDVVSLVEKVNTIVLNYVEPSEENIHHAEIEVADYGTISLELDANVAPITVENFLSLAESGFYDGLTFHRIMDGFMIQGGDPEGDGTGGSGKTIKGEFKDNGVSNSISHVRGVISMARSSNSYDSASSQFFIVQEDSTFLDGQYAAFGYVTDGMDIVDAICADAAPSDDNGTIPASQQPKITAIRVID